MLKSHRKKLEKSTYKHILIHHHDLQNIRKEIYLVEMLKLTQNVDDVDVIKL